MLFGISGLADYLFAAFAVAWLVSLFRAAASAQRAKGNMSVIMARWNAIAAEAQTEAERIIALLQEIRDQRINKPAD